MQNRGIILLLITTLLLSCSPKALREAEEVVTQADSMRAAGQMYGVDAGDSATLAQAYETLGSLSLFNFHFSPSYAHACYHYGRLLREKDNPVEAMQCFINATHIRTRDYHILGRVYSNMGDIAHLAGEFPLAYDMYERSGQMYLKNGDSLLYYYDLNNMAFELAEQGKKEETLILLNTIECADSILLSSVNLTKAEMYKEGGLYDSAIHYANLVCKSPEHQITRMLIMAQSYSYMKLNDSAVYYANELIRHTDELFYTNSALYILTHEDNKKNIEEVRNISAERSDTQKLIEIRQGKLSQAVQLLEQDLHREPDLAWLYAIIVTLVVIGLVVFIYIHQKRRKRTLLTQQVNELEDQHEQIVQEHSEYTNKLREQVEETCALWNQSPDLTKDLSWNDFENMCHFVDQHLCMIASKLRQKQILNETEVRLCILVLLNLNRKQISETLPYSLNSVGKLKDHTAKLLGTTGKNLHDFLLNVAVKG